MPDATPSHSPLQKLGRAVVRCVSVCMCECGRSWAGWQPLHPTQSQTGYQAGSAAPPIKPQLLLKLNKSAALLCGHLHLGAAGITGAALCYNHIRIILN